MMYLSQLLWYFLYARTFTKSWCFCWKVYVSCTIHKLVSRYDHLSTSTMYSIFNWKGFELSYQQTLFRESGNKCASDETQGLDNSQVVPKGVIPGVINSIFLVRVYTIYWEHTYVSLQLRVENAVSPQPCVGKWQISLVLFIFLDCIFRLWFETP